MSKLTFYKVMKKNLVTVENFSEILFFKTVKYIIEDWDILLYKINSTCYEFFVNTEVEDGWISKAQYITFVLSREIATLKDLFPEHIDKIREELITLFAKNFTIIGGVKNEDTEDTIRKQLKEYLLLHDQAKTAQEVDRALKNMFRVIMGRWIGLENIPKITVGDIDDYIDPAFLKEVETCLTLERTTFVPKIMEESFEIVEKEDNRDNAINWPLFIVIVGLIIATYVFSG